MDFFAVLSVDDNFILTSDRQGEWRTSKFSINLIEQYDRISLGATLSPVKYDLETALYTKVLAVLDIDSKDISDIEEFFSEAQPTITLETNRGYHFIWCSETPLKVRNGDGTSAEDYDTFLTINTFLKNLTKLVKNRFTSADKFFNTNYTRLPRPDRVYRFSGKFYQPLDLLVKFNELFKVKSFSDEPTIQSFNFINKSVAKSMFTLNQLISCEESCPTLKNLIENPEKHSYHDWHALTRHFANKIILTGNPIEEKAVKLHFHSLMSKYHDYDYNKNEKFLMNLVEDGFKPLSCQVMSTLPLTRCYDCPFKQKPAGAVYSISETIAIPSSLQKDVVVMNGNIYAIQTDDNNIKLNYMSKDFSILDVVEVALADGVNKFARLFVDRDERILTFDKNNKPENIGIILDSNPKYNKKITEIFIHNYQLKSNSKKFLPEVINYFETGFFTLNAQTRFKIRSMNLYPETLYETAGEFDEWKEAYRQAFELDETVRIMTGVYLTQYFISKNMKYVLSLNPILLVVGITGAGKTLRTSIVNSLYYFPDTRLSKEGLFSTSVPYLSSIQGKVQIPFNIDEMRVITQQDEDMFKELVYFISNGTPRNNMKGRQYPLKAPVIITGELKNTTFIHRSEVDGINRRLMVITLSAVDIEKVLRLTELVPTLQKNYGFVHRFFEIYNFDETVYRKAMLEIKKKHPTVFPTIVSTLAAMYSLLHQFKDFIGVTYSLEDFLNDIEVIRFELNQDPVWNYLEEEQQDTITSTVLSVLADMVDVMKKMKQKVYNKSKIEFKKRQFLPQFQQIRLHPEYKKIETIVHILMFKPVVWGNVRYSTDTTNIFYLLSEENDLETLSLYFTRVKNDVLQSIYSYISKNIYTFDEVVQILPYLKDVILKYLEEKSPSASVSHATEVVNNMVYLSDPEVLKIELNNLATKLNNNRKQQVQEELT